MSKLKAFLVDDENIALRNLALLINEHCKDDVEVVGSASCLNTAFRDIRSQQIDVLFIDIQMPEMDGFEFLDLFEAIDFHVVFVTAYSQYAIRAIKVGAADYLLKPISISELRGAVDTIRRKRSSQAFTTGMTERIMVPGRSKGEVNIVELAELAYVSGSDNYSVLHVSGHNDITVTKTIKYFELTLSKSGFIRIHKTYLANLMHISSVSFDGRWLTLSNGEQLPVSRRKLLELRTILNNYMNKR